MTVRDLQIGHFFIIVFSGNFHNAIKSVLPILGTKLLTIGTYFDVVIEYLLSRHTACDTAAPLLLFQRKGAHSDLSFLQSETLKLEKFSLPLSHSSVDGNWGVFP